MTTLTTFWLIFSSNSDNKNPIYDSNYLGFFRTIGLQSYRSMFPTKIHKSSKTSKTNFIVWPSNHLQTQQWKQHLPYCHLVALHFLKQKVSLAVGKNPSFQEVMSRTSDGINVTALRVLRLARLLRILRTWAFFGVDLHQKFRWWICLDLESWKKVWNNYEDMNRHEPVNQLLVEFLDMFSRFMVLGWHTMASPVRWLDN